MRVLRTSGTEVSRMSTMMIGIGGSYHFSQLDRLDPYVAVDVMIGSSSSSMEGTDAIFGAYSSGDSYSMTSKASGFGFGVGAGFDYYFAENVFVGAELGFTYMSWNDKGGSSDVTIGGTTVSTTTLSSGSSSSFGNSATAALRLGWRF